MRPPQEFLKEFHDLKVGDKVHCFPEHVESLKDCENGRIRSIIKDRSIPGKAHIFVVYTENDDWNDVLKYTAKYTNEIDIALGWI